MIRSLSELTEKIEDEVSIVNVKSSLVLHETSLTVCESTSRGPQRAAQTQLTSLIPTAAPEVLNRHD